MYSFAYCHFANFTSWLVAFWLDGVLASFGDETHKLFSRIFNKLQKQLRAVEQAFFECPAFIFSVNTTAEIEHGVIVIQG